MKKEQEFFDVLDKEIILKRKNINSQFQSPFLQGNTDSTYNKCYQNNEEKEENQSLFNMSNIAMQVYQDNKKLVDGNLKSQVF